MNTGGIIAIIISITVIIIILIIVAYFILSRSTSSSNNGNNLNSNQSNNLNNQSNNGNNSNQNSGLMATPATNFNPSNQPLIIGGNYPTFCLDVPNQSKDILYPLQPWKCNGGSNQNWLYNPSTKTLTNQNSGLCLDVQNAQNVAGTSVGQYTCTPNDSAQQWTYNSTNASLSPANAPGMCLDLGVVNGNLSTIINPCNNYPTQQFYLDSNSIWSNTRNTIATPTTNFNPSGQQIITGDYYPQYCLDDTAGNTGTLYPLQVWTCGGPSNTNQSWTYDSTAKTLKNKTSGLCLDVQNAQNSDFTQVGQYTCTPNDAAQQWTYNSTNASLSPANAPGMCLSLAAYAFNGQRTVIRPCDKSISQQWYIK